MLAKNYITILALFILQSACSTEADNSLPNRGNDSGLKQRVEELEKDAAADSADDRHQEQGAQLTMKTVGETNEYLSKLYKNINDTREQDLPEWQEMYTAITDKAAMEDPKYGIGPRNLKTNFGRLQEKTEQNYADIGNLDVALKQNSVVDGEQNKSLELILARLKTIDNNIKDLNNTVNQKFEIVGKKLADFDGRIVGVENRMKTAEIDLDSFRSEFVEYKQRVTNIENLLRRYDLAVMHNDIKSLKEITTNHEERLIDLFGKVQINKSEITINRNNLIEAEQELSGVSSDVGTLKVGVSEIFDRLGTCQCFQETLQL